MQFSFRIVFREFRFKHGIRVMQAHGADAARGCGYEQAAEGAIDNRVADAHSFSLLGLKLYCER
jgi:hypothetical protein